MNSKHVEMLQRMANESWRGSPEHAALDAAIAVLSAPAEAQAQGGGEVAMEAWNAALNDAGELRTNAPDERYERRAQNVEAWIRDNRPSPPSAPVEARLPPRKNEREADGKFRTVYLFDTPRGQGRFQQQVEAFFQQPAAVDEDYSELLYAVVRKFPGETRHATALRYIREAESAEALAGPQGGEK